MSDSLRVIIKYDIAKDEVDISGDVTEQGAREIIEAFLRAQMGQGEDTSRAEERDVYTIEIKWDVEGDNFRSKHDCGNKGLREGILSRVLSELAGA
jgi:hypothetical protein